MRRYTVLLILSLLVALPAWAATENVSYSTWQISGDKVYLRISLKTQELKDIVRAGSALPSPAAIADYVLSHVAVASAQGACQAIDQGEDVGRLNTLSPYPGLDRFEIVFACPGRDGLILSNDVLFDRVPRHLDYARLQIDGGAFTLHLFTATHPKLWLAQLGQRSVWTDGMTYLGLGLGRIDSGPVRLAFFLGLALFVGRFRDLGSIAGSLCLGYILSATILGSGILAVRSDLVDLAIDLLVVAIGAEAVARTSGARNETALAVAIAAILISVLLVFHQEWAKLYIVMGLGLFAAGLAAMHVQSTGRNASRYLAAVAFGFADGCAIADNLAPLKLSMMEALPVLFGTALGVVCAASILLLALSACGMMLRWSRGKFLWPLLVDFGTAIISGLGVFWLLIDAFASSA